MSPDNILEAKKFVFIVGSGRSGTTWLQLLLSRAPAIVSTTETYLFSGYLRSMFSTWESHRQFDGRMGLHHDLSDADFNTLVRHVASEVFAKVAAKKPGASVILDKTPNHAYSGKEILRVIPNAYFLHIVRDPRAVASSLMAVARERSDGSWAPRDAYRAAEFWVSYVSSARSIKSLTPNYRELRYRDLHEVGPTKLFELFQWLGIDTSIAVCERYFAECEIDKLRQGRIDNAPFEIDAIPDRQTFFRVGQVDSWRRALSRVEIMAIECAAAQLMTEYGFDPSIPIWLRNLYKPIPKFKARIRQYLRRYG